MIVFSVVGRLSLCGKRCLPCRKMMRATVYAETGMFLLCFFSLEKRQTPYLAKGHVCLFNREEADLPCRMEESVSLLQRMKKEPTFVAKRTYLSCHRDATYSISLEGWEGLPCRGRKRTISYREWRMIFFSVEGRLISSW